MHGLFVIVYTGLQPGKRAPETRVSRSKPQTVRDEPSMADCPFSLDSNAVRFSRRIVFVADDGSVWLLRDRFKQLPHPVQVRKSGMKR